MSTGEETSQPADRLLAWFDDVPAVTVAFSGGVDSGLVVAAAARAPHVERVVAVTAVSPALPAGTLDDALALTRSLGVEHRQVTTRELDVVGYSRNGHDRCFFCKSTLVDALPDLPGHVVVTGTNADDVRAGWRPGIRAAAQRGARTPLADAGLTKADVRAVARTWRLPTWDRPAAPCLSSRIAYGVTITPARLARVDRAETAARTALRHAGLAARNLRVRDLGDAARLEVDADEVDAARCSRAIDAVRSTGFAGPVTVAAFVSGGLNDALSPSLRHDPGPGR